MKPDHIERWREYLVDQLHQRHGTEDDEQAIDCWLRSMSQNNREDPEPRNL